jgi:sterol desaturase/sphingolipid hydroxylase (fatty acid hydroxylase superfamily)
LDLSASTAIRFHFGEMFLSGLFRTLGVILIGVSPSTILVYEVAFEAWVAFQHSNWRLPFRLEKVLIVFFVTPRMHGIHHSDIQAETNSNFSNLLNVWDRIHRTMRLNVPQESIVIGVPAYKDEHGLSVKSLLGMPFTPQRDYWKSPRETTLRDSESASTNTLVP